MDTETVLSHSPTPRGHNGFLRSIRQLSILSRGWKIAIIGSIDASCVFTALWLALSLRLNRLVNPDIHLIQVFAAVAILTVCANLAFGLYRAVIRRAGDTLQFRLLRAAAISGIFVIIVDYFDYGASMPRSTFVIYAFILFVFTTVTRTAWKALTPLLESMDAMTRVAIYGAGSAGQQLLEVLRQNSAYKPVAFIDTAATLQGIEISGLRVFSPDELKKLEATDSTKPLEVLLAIPSASADQSQSLIRKLTDAGHQVKTVPGLDELLLGKHIGQLTDVQPNDVLSRQSVAPDFNLMRQFIAGKTVLITGAGGSIGSEICRQLLPLQPQRLVILDSSEPALYQIDQSLTANQSSVKIDTVLGSVLDQKLVDDLFSSRHVDVVFHAAAYKHVPLVESNPLEGARVNILGTRNVAESARQHNVSNFVLVSTDKAVRPTNVMGATKRAAETIIQDMQTRSEKTRFSMVRFGNVLGSSGSVVPKFLKQIEQGGPITITHPEITRYFMTIPEASQLVVQTGAMAQGGEVFLLDMGEPVKIKELATKLVALSGRKIKTHPGDTGIALEYTGLRPGEKLYEELLIEAKSAAKTGHNKIFKANEPLVPSDDVSQFIHNILSACTTRDQDAVRALLLAHVTDYTPATH